MKKILSVIITVFTVMTILCTAPVCAADSTDIEISVDVSFNDITVTVESGYDNMTAILKNKANTELYGIYSDYSPETANGVKIHTFNFKMPDDVNEAPSGAYVVYAGNEESESLKEFNFATVSAKVAFYNTLNDKTADGIKSFFSDDAYKYAVPVDLTAYMNLESKFEGKIFNLVNGRIVDFADTYEDIADDDLTTLERLDSEFKENFSLAMEIAELAVVEANDWTQLAEEKIENEKFDAKYYVANENTSIVLNLADVFPYYENERAKVEVLDLSKYAGAFDKATLHLLSKADFGTFRTGFIYFKDKASIEVSADVWSNIQKLIDSGNDTTLWRNIKERNYSTCDEMVADIGVEAQALIDSGILNNTTVSGGTGGGGGGVTSVDKPVVPSGSGTVSGGNTPEITPLEPSLTGTFADVSKTHWAYEAIEELASKGVLSGKGDGNFAPDDGVTREEFVKIIVAAFELSDETAECDFNDVDKDSWSYPYIATANKLDIVSGDGESFYPKAKISRQDMAVIIFRVFEYLELEVSGTSVSFDDAADISEYARGAVEALTAAGIINGMGDGTFAPEAGVTRAQSAKVVYDLLSLSGGGK